LRSNTKDYGSKTHQTDSPNSDTVAPSGRGLYHLLFSLQAAGPETFGYTLVYDKTLANCDKGWHFIFRVRRLIKNLSSCTKNIKTRFGIGQILCYEPRRNVYGVSCEEWAKS